MCFSTTASFTSGVILTVIGVACISKTHKRYQLLFACIPFVFAMQQFSEGFVWLSLSGSTHYLSQKFSTNLFLTFALIVWPLWVPLSMFLMEKTRKRKIILGIIAGTGVLFSIGSIYFLITDSPIAIVANNHIHYDVHVSDTILLIAGTLYLIPTVVSHFISSIRLVPFMGFMVLSSHIVSRVFFKDNVLSVWCFFAAIISITIYFIITRSQEPRNENYKLKKT